MSNDKNIFKCQGRRDSLKSATLPWMTPADFAMINKFYDMAKHMSATGSTKYEVDHIIPLNNPIVCGLHHQNNLQVITVEQNKLKGNDIRLEPEADAVTIATIEGLSSIRNNGKFAKGVSGNPKGRPPKARESKVQQTTLNQLFDEADGDAVKFQHLVLKNGSKLGLDLMTAMKLAKELSAYQTPRKASIETRNEDVKSYVIQYNIPGSNELKTIDEVKDDE